MFGAENTASSPTGPKSAGLCVAGAIAAAATTGMIMLALPKTAAATPAYSATTGYPCERCHTKAGSAELTSFGQTWAKQKK